MTLKQLIRQRGFRHDWIAEQIGVTQPCLSHAIAGRRALPPETIKPLARLLRVPPAEIERAIGAK
jgi:plasmid maintenance system antidote protein VapI